MAKCEKREIPQPKHEYVLTLTEREAKLVKELALSVYGKGEARDDCAAIQEALENAGVHSRGVFVLLGELQVKEGPNA